MKEMTYNPKVSIIIPAYNASAYLQQAIESALGQTYKNIEIIVVNDGSKDDGKTALVASEYEGKIKYIEKPNGGSSSALNCGIANMTGEWFSWLSHDDLYYPEKIEKQILLLNQMLQSGEVAEKCCVFGASDIIDFEGKFIRKSEEKPNMAKAGYIHGLKNNLPLVAGVSSAFCFNGCTCLIHKNVFNDVGLFNENLRLVNDVDMWKRIFKAGYKICYVGSSIVMGRMHKKQISASIGFSYHNPEQDALWTDTFEWLKVQCAKENDYTGLKDFSFSAFSKGRVNEGKQSLKIVLSKLSFGKALKLRIKIRIFRIKNFTMRQLKKVYRKIFIK